MYDQLFFATYVYHRSGVSVHVKPMLTVPLAAFVTPVSSTRLTWVLTVATVVKHVVAIGMVLSTVLMTWMTEHVSVNLM